MASLFSFSFSFSLPLTTTTPSSTHKVQILGTTKVKFARKTSCKATKSEDSKPSPNPNSSNDKTLEAPAEKFDRRNMLLGLGGLYGVATGLGSKPPPVTAIPIFDNPVLTPDLSNCHRPETGPPDLVDKLICCPPEVARKISDFKLPIPPTKLRVRQPAHAVSEEYIEKYKTAVQLMKDLPDSDPRSFKNQANVHCAYCEGSYDQLLAQDKKFEFQVHHSWLFFPFHRWYLYFYERILGKLIDDPTFALPFWNWDSPLGMTMPRIYTDDPNSPLYDRLRSTSHQPPTLLDFNYNKNSPQYSEGRSVIRSNLTYMYRQMVSNAKNPEMFFGCPFRAGETPETGPGSIENVPHDIVHLWSGDDTQCHNEDLGSFHSAGRDPMFFAHHSNVDRMWYLWKNKLGGKYNRDFDDSDWLNTEFYFYDEKAELVRVKIRDCLDNEKQLGYTYKEVDLPWLYSKPIPLSKRSMKSLSFDDPKFLKAADGVKYVLDRSPIKVLVPLPKKKNRLLRSLDEKESVEEVLEIEGITFDTNQHVKFNVYVNDEDVDNPCYSEFAGSFVNVPHHSNSKSVKKTCLRLGLSDLLDAMEVEDDEYVIVTLKPFHINNRVTIDSINIELVHNSHYKPSRPPIPGKVEELS